MRCSPYQAVKLTASSNSSYRLPPLEGLLKLCVWLHSSVGRASHQYRGGHGLNLVEALIFFRLLPSSCLNWKIYCDDHSSLSYICFLQADKRLDYGSRHLCLLTAYVIYIYVYFP